MVTWMRPRLYPNLKRIPRVLTIIIYSRDSTFMRRIFVQLIFQLDSAVFGFDSFSDLSTLSAFPQMMKAIQMQRKSRRKRWAAHTHTRSCSDLNKRTLFWHITVPQLSLYSFVDVIDRFLPSVVFFSFTFCQKRRRATTGGQLDDKRREMLKRHPLSLCIDLKCKGKLFYPSVTVYRPNACCGKGNLSTFLYFPTHC